MNNDKGKLYYGLGLDNNQLRADAAESRNIIKGIGDTAVSEGNRIDSISHRIGAALAVAFSAQQATAFARSIVQVTGEMQQLDVAFTTMLNSKAKSDALLSQAVNFAAKTPYDLLGVADGIKQLLAYGTAAEDAIETVEMLGNVSAGLSVPLGDMVYLYGTLKSQGRAMLVDIRQFAGRGVPIYEELAKVLGVSVSEVNKYISAGKVGFPEVEQAFKNMTSEGGKFYNLLQEQSKTITGQISNLKDNFDMMLNDIGSANEDVISGAISGASYLIENYQEVGETLAALVATYGTYRAALIATAAIQNSVATVKHTEEAAELYKLLTVEQRAQIAKQGLAKTSAEYYALVKAETAANVQAAQGALTKARADVTAASQAVASRRAEYVAAKQMEQQRLAELMHIGATGTAKQIETAQRKLATAETKRETAALAYQSAARDFNAKKTAVETAARTANTTATAVNTAAQTANVTATGFLTVAKTRLMAVAAKLNAVIMANPYALAAAAAIALGYGLYKLVTYQTEAEKAQSKLNETIKEADKSLQSELYQINLMFARLKAAKEGTDEYKDAKQAIISQYGEYLKKLGDEKTALNDIAAAYSLITEEATKAANARAIQQVTQEAGNIVSEKQSDVYDEVKKMLGKEFKGQKGSDGKIDLADEYLIKLKPVIMGGAEITSDIEAIIKQFDRTRYIPGDPMTGIGSYTYTANALREELSSLAKVRAAAEQSVKEATEKFGSAPAATDGEAKQFDAMTASLQQLMEQLPKAQDALAALKKADTPDAAAIAAKEREIQLIKDQTLAREKELSVIRDVKEQIEALEKEQLGYGKDDPEYKALQTRIDALKTKLPQTAGQTSKAENEAARIKRETAERNQKIQEYEESVKKQIKQAELDISQSRIDAMEEGFAKEQAQIELAYQRLIFANQQREAEMVEALRDARELEWENKNPQAKAKGETFDRSTVTAADLSPEQQAQIAEYYKVAEEIRNKANKTSLEQMLADFMTYEQQRADIVEEYNGKITQLREAGENEAAEVAEKRRDEALTALAQSMIEESDLWVRLFEDASKKSVSQIEDIISETESLLDYLKGKDGAEIPLGFTDEQLKSLKGSPEAIKKIQDAIKRLKGEIGSKSPFKQLANDINDAIDQIKAGGKDNIGAGIMNIGNAVNTIAPHVKQFGDDLSNIFGDSSIGENIGILTDTLAGIGTAAAGVGQIMTGDILGGITSVVSGISSIFSMARQAAERHREALAAIMNSQIAQQREYNLLLLEQNLLYEKGTTIFGSDEYGKAMQAIEVYKQALADLNEAMAGTDEQKRAQSRRYKFLSLFGIKDAQSTLKQIYAGLADIEIVTGHKRTGLFGWGKGKDLYSSVLSVYPDLIKANGEFNKELAQSIINTRKMSGEDKTALQTMIDLYEQYEEAMQEVRDYLSGIFGELGNTMSDALVDAFKNGSDAAEAFSKSVSEMLEDLAQQMIYSVTLAPIMEKAQEQMLEVMKNGNLSDDEKFARYAGILSYLTDEALSQQENANYLMKLYQDMAAAKGIDIFQPDDTGREATSKGIATASQDSVNELNGRFTAIQSHTFDIREAVDSIAASQMHDFSRIEVNTDRLQTIDANVFGIREGTNILVANSARMLEHLAGIETNTDRLHAIDTNITEMRSGLSALRHSVDDMALKGIKLRT